jgi:hypothetical protein
MLTLTCPLFRLDVALEELYLPGATSATALLRYQEKT